MGNYMDYLSGRGNGGKKQGRTVSNDSNYIEISSEVQSLLEKRNKVIKDVSDLVARYAVTRGQHATDMHGVKNEITSMIKGFSVEEQQAILVNALASVIVNM